MKAVDRRIELPRPVVTIHQPNFIPWPGYFHKMSQVDIFIYLDNVPFSKNSLQNRNKILVNGQPKWLTVPVLTKGKLAAETRCIEINKQTKWQKKHLSTLSQNYSKTPYFQWVFGEIEGLYQHPFNRLMDFNMALNEKIRKMLNLDTPIRLASDLVSVDGATERLVELVKSCGGKAYLSGRGGKKYLEEGLFSQHGIMLTYQDFVFTPYRQPGHSFIPNLSTLDLLFNLGPGAENWLRGK